MPELAEQVAELRGAVLARLDGQAGDLARLEKKIDQANAHAETMKSRLDGQDRRLDEHGRRLHDLEKHDSTDNRDRTTFWGRVIGIIVTGSGYVLAVWHPWSRSG